MEKPYINLSPVQLMEQLRADKSHLCQSALHMIEHLQRQYDGLYAHNQEIFLKGIQTDLVDKMIERKIDPKALGIIFKQKHLELEGGRNALLERK